MAESTWAGAATSWLSDRASGINIAETAVSIEFMLGSQNFTATEEAKIHENFCGTFNPLCYIHALSNGLHLAIQTRRRELPAIAPIK